MHHHKNLRLLSMAILDLKLLQKRPGVQTLKFKKTLKTAEKEALQRGTSSANVLTLPEEVVTLKRVYYRNVSAVSSIRRQWLFSSSLLSKTHSRGTK